MRVEFNNAMTRTRRNVLAELDKTRIEMTGLADRLTNPLIFGDPGIAPIRKEFVGPLGYRQGSRNGRCGVFGRTAARGSSILYWWAVWSGPARQAGRRVGGATLGVMTDASLAVAVIGQALAQARGLVTKHAIKQVDRLMSNRAPLWRWL